MKNYIMVILIAFDQFVGAFIPGAYPDETISARCFRQDWRFQYFVNWLFNDKEHCERAYWLEVTRRQAAPLKQT